MLSKRGPNIKTDRLLLTPNPSWNKTASSQWYKNCPVGINEVGAWTKLSAEKAGLDVKRVKITNHSTRSTAVSQLAKAGVGEQQLIKITGHSSAGSLRPYLQMDQEHHSKLIEKLRSKSEPSPSTSSSSATVKEVASEEVEVPFANNLASNSIVYSNCTFLNCPVSARNPQ